MIYNRDKEIEVVRLLTQFQKHIHKEKSAVYGDSWRKHDFDSVKCNFRRKADAVEGIFSSGKRLSELSVADKSTLIDNFLDMSLYSNLFTSFILESMKQSDEEQTAVLNRVSAGMSVHPDDELMKEFVQVLNILISGEDADE